MSEETVQVKLAPYKETPEWYRTIVKVEGNKRWFEKAKVGVVYQDEDQIVLEMPKRYAETRQGISSLILAENSDLPGGSEGGGSTMSSKEEEPVQAERIDLQLGPGGRVLIPASFRDAMRVAEGDRLMARVVDGELRLISPKMAIRRAQKWVRETIPAEVDLVEDLFEMRRQEVADELKDE